MEVLFQMQIWHFTIQALEDSELSVANYQEVMANVNKDAEITEVITNEFQKLKP